MLAGAEAAKVLAEEIQAPLAELRRRRGDETLDARRTGVSSDDMSSAMLPFLAEIDELRRLPGGAAVAFDLVVTLGMYSYGDMDGGGCGYGNRPSDLEVDELLVELATERRGIEPNGDFRKVHDVWRERAEYFAECGIEGFCAQSIDLLSGWEKDGLAIGESAQGH